MSRIDLTVVLASGNDERSLAEALHALDSACAGLTVEWILVHAGTLSSSLSTAIGARSLRSIERPTGTLTPVLWGAGASAAGGPVVAFTTTQLRVSPGWGRALVSAVTGDTVGVAGPIGLAARTSSTSAAIYFVRFSGFLPESQLTEGAPCRDIPGDNAAYRRDAIACHSDLLADGFWEVEFHRRFAAEGLRLRMLTTAQATMVGPVDLPAVVRQRFAHGVEFGRSRVRSHGESAMRLTLVAPLVPLVMILRMGRRVLPYARYRVPFLAALPGMVVLTCAWALGEMVGALRAAKRMP